MFTNYKSHASTLSLLHYTLHTTHYAITKYERFCIIEDLQYFMDTSIVGCTGRPHSGLLKEMNEYEHRLRNKECVYETKISPIIISTKLHVSSPFGW
jgi:hypothetical protein